MWTQDPEAQATAHQLVHCVLEADPDGLTETLDTVVDQPADELRPYVREVVAELINVATAAIRGYAAPAGKVAFAVDLRDDEDERVAIDELTPPVRATIRAMLAELNGSPDDALFQLDLAVRGVDRRSGLDTVRRALTMTIGLLHWSEQSEQLEGVMNMEPTANEADVLEQQLDALDSADSEDIGDGANAGDLGDTGRAGAPGNAAETFEANPADVAEQHQAVPDEDDEPDR